MYELINMIACRLMNGERVQKKQGHSMQKGYLMDKSDKAHE